MNKSLISKVLNDRDFLDKLLKCENDIDIEKTFKDRSIYLHVEDLEEVCDVIQVYKSLKNEGRIKDEDTSKVSGGKKYSELKDLILSKIKISRTVDGLEFDSVKR